MLNSKQSAKISPRHWNTGLVSSGVSFTSWWEGASLALLGHPSSDGITIKIPYGIDVLLHLPALHPHLLVLILLLDQLRLASGDKHG